MPPKSTNPTPSKEELNQVIPALYTGFGVTLGGMVLPKPGDDLEWEYGLNIYPKMLQEPTLSACDDIVRMLVLEADPEIKPNIEEPDSESEPGYNDLLSEHEASKEVADYVEDLLKIRFQTKLRTIFWQMLEGYAVGSKLAEKVYGILDGAVQIVDVRPKSRKMYSLVVSPFYDVLGIRAGVANVGMITDLNGFDFGNGFFPIDRFWLFTPKKGEDGSPIGVAALRSCYAPWYEKLLTRPESLKYMRQFGGGMVSLELPPITTQNKDVILPDGTKVDRVAYYQSLITAFASNGGAFATENGSKINVHSPNGEGKAFEAKFDRCDREMCLAFLKSSRAVLEAQYGSRADSQTSLDLLKSVVNWLRQALCESFSTVIATIVELRFGIDAVQNYLPSLVLEEAKDQDIPALLTALSSALSSGVITPQQMQFWDRKLGQPVRDTADMQDPTEEEDAPEDGATFRRGKKSKASTIGSRLSQRYAAATEPLSEHR
ncbi:MAG: hypothetical protein JST12_14660 [Armatimonadetes bacterium]|nr:hypothetical protein [Armatimonadota bacterium]